MQSNQTPVTNHDTPHPLGPRPDSSDPMVAAARRANVGAALTMERDRTINSRDPITRLHHKVNRLEHWISVLQAQDDRIALLEATLSRLAQRVDDIDAVADYAAELGESAERRLSA